MHYELKMFNTGQITLPKKWRSQFRTDRFTARETEDGLCIVPVLWPSADEKNIVRDLAKTLEADEGKLLKIRISNEKNDPGVLYETDQWHGIFFPNGISPGELLRVFGTPEADQPKMP